MIISGTDDEFKQKDRNTIYVDIDYSMYYFKKLPFIETVIHCVASCEDLVGVDSVINESRQGFRI